MRIPEERRQELIKLSGGYVTPEDDDEVTESISELPSFQKPFRAPARQVGKKEKEDKQEVHINIINFASTLLILLTGVMLQYF